MPGVSGSAVTPETTKPPPRMIRFQPAGAPTMPRFTGSVRGAYALRSSLIVEPGCVDTPGYGVTIMRTGWDGVVAAVWAEAGRALLSVAAAPSAASPRTRFIGCSFVRVGREVGVRTGWSGDRRGWRRAARLVAVPEGPGRIRFLHLVHRHAASRGRTRMTSAASAAQASSAGLAAMSSVASSGRRQSGRGPEGGTGCLAMPLGGALGLPGRRRTRQLSASDHQHPLPPAGGSHEG